MIKCYHEKAFDAVVVVVVVVVAVVDVDVHCCLFFINSAVFRNIFWEKTGILFASKHFEHTHLQVLKQRERESDGERE